MKRSSLAQGGRTPAAGKALVLRESDIQRTVVDFLKAEQWRVFHFEDGFDERSKKRKGEAGMPDLLCIRYGGYPRDRQIGLSVFREEAEVLWVELKRVDKRGRTTKLSPAQETWHEAERARGALTLRAGVDFPATIEGFLDWYKTSGLARGR